MENENRNGKCPYDDLFIYYLDGAVPEGLILEQSLGQDFIGNWMEDGFSFLFFSSPAEERVSALVADNPDLKLIDHYTMSYEDWLGEKPATFHIGHFTISPPWDQPDRFFLPNFGAYHILLDPGVVFGTGTHPTTRDCLELMELAVRTAEVKQVLDLGCGTGLLAIAAGKLRCKTILAVDFNALAAKTTRKNVLLNGFDDRIITVQGLAEQFTSVPADLLIANIHFEVMEKILGSKGFCDHNQFILSGLLKTQAEKIDDILKDLPVTVLDKRVSNGVWHTFYGKKNGASS